MKAGSAKPKQSLTERQQQVVALVGQGLSNKEIANQLGISEGTVKQHIFAIFRELNLSSRAKLALVGQKMGTKYKAQQEKNTGLSKILTGTFSWRLISTVAISFALPPADKPNLLVRRNQAITQAREEMAELLEALDGKSMILPDGGLLAWFGYPTSHIDDPDRASFFAQSFYAYLQSLKTEQIPRFGIGIATHAEVVPANSEQLITTKSFQVALRLATQSLQSGLVLANVLTARLAPSTVPWVELKRKGEAPQDASAEINQDHLFAMHPKPNEATVPATSYWGELKFLDEIFHSTQGGLAHWVAVESWPPSMAISLMDAIGARAKQAGFLSLRLHLTSTKQVDQILGSILKQIQFYINPAQRDETEQPDPILQLIDVLSELSSKTPVCVQVYGLQSLVVMRDILGARGIDRLISQKVIFVTSNISDIKNPKTSIRVLGTRPLDAVFNRVHVLEEPNIDLMPDGVRVDIQALFDDLTPIARHIALLASQTSAMTTDVLLAELRIPRPLVQHGLRELIQSGLIFMSADGVIQFRDALTAEAIAQLNQFVN